MGRWDRSPNLTDAPPSPVGDSLPMGENAVPVMNYV